MYSFLFTIRNPEDQVKPWTWYFQDHRSILRLFNYIATLFSDTHRESRILGLTVSGIVDKATICSTYFVLSVIKAMVIE